MIDGIATGKNDTGIILNFYFLPPEFPGYDRLKTDKGLKLQFYIVFAGKFILGRLFAFGLGLGNQDFFYCFGLNGCPADLRFIHKRFG